MSPWAPTVKRWTRAEYERLVDLGAFERESIELIDGQLLVAEPQGASHASTVGAIDEALRAVLPRGWIVRTQAPISLDDASEPEPDPAVVQGRHADYRHAHPARPALVVEVAESSLAFDRRQKGSFYARARIEDYWIANLLDRVLEVYRDPVEDASAPSGWRYRSITILAPPALVAPLAFPSCRLSVTDLLL